MRYLLALFWLLVIPLVGIAVIRPQIFMPGALTARHGALERNCQSCHVPWKGSPDQRCAECHAREQPIINPERHGANCKSCHSEHRGRNTIATKFDHSKVSYELSVKHGELSCRDCHAAGYVSGTMESCADCHAKPGEKNFNLTLHVESFGTSCLDCHRRASVELDLKDLDHSRFGYAISSKYSSLACTDCHTPGVKWFNHSAVDYAVDAAHVKLNCSDCHATKYSFSPSACTICHLKPDVSNGFDMRRHESMLGTSCLNCHGKAGFSTGSFSHGITGYAIRKGHSRLDCLACHPQKLTQYACNGACHGQDKLLREHRKHGITDYSDCLACHRSKEAEKGPRGKKEDD